MILVTILHNFTQGPFCPSDLIEKHYALWHNTPTVWQLVHTKVRQVTRHVVEVMELMMSKLQNVGNSGRRSFLRKATAAGLTIPLGAQSLLGSVAQARGLDLGSSVDLSGVDNPTQKQGGLKNLPTNATRRIHLVNAHTGDDFELVYFTHGIYLKDNIARFNHLMRDRRANAATNMDTTLYDQLFLLREKLGISDPIRILSGYRTPETNAKLRSRSKRVAKYSLHMEGRAADIYVPGIPVDKLQKVALELEAGGVGLYSHSNFIHLDTGPVRQWGS